MARKEWVTIRLPERLLKEIRRAEAEGLTREQACCRVLQGEVDGWLNDPAPRTPIAVPARVVPRTKRLGP